MNKEDILIRWLQDAHAMERAVLKTLEDDEKEFALFGAIQKQISEHIADSKEQAEKVKDCLKALGADVFETNSEPSSVIGVAQGASAEILGDEKLIKNIMTEYVTEHAEIAMYRKILCLADECDKPQIVEMCQQILIQEEEMAELVIENLDRVVSSYISRMQENIHEENNR